MEFIVLEKGEGYGISLKDENEMTLPKFFFFFLIFNLVNYEK